MIKDILVNLSVGADRDPACDYAISVAQSFEAHLTAIAFAYDPRSAGGASVWASLPAQFLEEQLAKVADIAQSAAGAFDERARRAGIAADARVLTAGRAEAADLFGRMARRFDLSIVAQREPDKPYGGMILDAALFDSGRPVLIVPYIETGGLRLESVMVAWDGSRNAARAIADAAPFLARARVIEVVTVGAEAKSDELPGADIAHHLARHGLKVELKIITVSDLDVANTILSHAADASTDFIVMGGYGHSRLREFVLGGATRGILATMTVPILMSH